jgi:hypothetical protein
MRANPILWLFTMTMTILFLGCSGVRKLESASVTLERTSCEGTCPAYTVTIDGNGQVTYHGNSHVDITGEQKAQVRPEQVERLLKSADAIHFFALKGEYFGCLDFPTEFISISVNGKTKKIRNDFCGTDKSGPQVDLDNFAIQIDSLANVRRWISCDYSCLQDAVHNGLDVNAKGPGGTTVLTMAIYRKDLRSLRLLLDSGARINVADVNGLTPLMYAVMNDQPEMVKELLVRGADVNAVDKRGFTVLASTAKGWPMRKMLVRAGARYERLTTTGSH